MTSILWALQGTTKDWTSGIQTGTSSWIPHTPSFSCFSSQAETWHNYLNSIFPSKCENDDSLLPKPQAVLDLWMRKGRQEVLIHWQGMPPAEATWENFMDIKQRFVGLALGDKGEILRGELLCA